MKKLWFRAKRYGWGWYPVTWQGWLCIIAFAALLFAGERALFRSMDGRDAPTSVAAMALYAAALVAALIAVCRRTGEKPGWRWGPPEKK